MNDLNESNNLEMNKEEGEVSNSFSYGMKGSSLLKETVKVDKNNIKKEDMWKCRVCFEDLNEPVVTQCGHIYCWTCIYTWYLTKNPGKFQKTRPTKNSPVQCAIVSS